MFMPHPIYDCARQVLGKTLSRLKAESERRCNVSDRSASEIIRQHHAGNAAGLSMAADILQEEIDRLPK